MEFGDILLRIAKNQPLSENEIQKLRLLGNQIELLAQFVTGLQDGSSSISAKSIKAGSVNVGKEVYASKAVRVYNSGTTIPNTTETEITTWTQEYNDGYKISSGEIEIPETGIYNIILSVNCQNTGGVGHRSSNILKNGSPHFPADTKDAVSGESTLLGSVRESNFQKGDLIRVSNWQDSGGNDTFIVSLVIRLIRLS